jgi:hypothetical protein
MADDCEGRAGQNKHRWNPEAENTICKDSQRERTFSERYQSVMSNLANLNLSTAVMQRSVRVGVLYPGRSVTVIVSWWFTSAPNYIISLGVGWLALLILAKRQCESLTSGIGAEEQTPTSFFISITEQKY